MIGKDIIGLRAELKIQYDEAVAERDAAREIYEDLEARVAKLGDFLRTIEDYRADRKVESRTYKPPGSGSKAATLEEAVLDVLGEGTPMRADEILNALATVGADELLPGDDRVKKMARLSVYLTRMHRRQDAPIAHDRETRTYTVVKK